MAITEDQINNTSDVTASSREPIRLIDCFTEILGYTLYLMKQIDNQAPKFENIGAHYKNLLARSLEKSRLAKISNVEWKKGCFPVCAWVDEMILCSTWEEKDKWRSQQLQLRYFKTTNAGDIFFSRLEQIKEKERDIREIYLYCLSLGFKGRFFKEEDELKLAEIKTDTLLALFPADEAMNLPESLFPEAYILQKAKKKGWKRGVSPFFLMIMILPPALIVVLYLFFSLHLDYLNNNFTNALQSRRLIIKTHAASVPANDVNPGERPSARSSDKK